MLPHVAACLIDGLTIIARGGGGGSGGGGGGGGVGSIIFVIGYLPTHLWGSWLRRRVAGPALVMGCIAGTIVMVVFWMLLAIFAVPGWGVLFACLSVLGGFGGYFGWGEKLFKRIKAAKKHAAKAAETDPAWDLASMQQRVQTVFPQFQNDWSTFNIDSMRTYLSPGYWQHMSLVMAALKQRGRRNNVRDPRLIETPEPISVRDFEDNTKDGVSFLVKGQAQDELYETVDNQIKQVFEDKSAFTEYWHFVRMGNEWMLGGIAQATANASMFRFPIQKFATDNNMFYSEDWGWLLLPSRGVLFNEGRFGRSDINNHVIGVYKNLLVELYTYVPDGRTKASNRQQFVVAQVALPKRYDSLIVEARQSSLINMFRRTPKGYNKLSLEWADFNKRYNVYATNVEQVTAFELLHPVYMEKLFALPFKVSIEVVDNVVYLYTQDRKADYALMYGILKDAFEEMKL